MIYFCLLTLGIIARSGALPTGAPESACRSLLPRHPGNAPQKTAPPFIVTADRSGHDRVNVTISSPTGQSFEGFILQARSASDRSKFIRGVFEISAPSVYQGIRCYDVQKSTLTHVNTKPKKEISTVWVASQVTEDIIFRATVAINYGQFWKEIDSNPIKMMEMSSEHPPVNKPFVEEMYDGCLTTKGCMGIPKRCVADRSCEVLFTYKDNMDGTIRFALHGKLKSSQYMAMALSDDGLMGDDSVTECFENGPNDIKLRRSWNEGKSNTRTTDEDEPYEYKIEDGIAACSWSEPNVTSHFGRTYDLYYGPVYVLIATGPIENGILQYHSLKNGFKNPVDFFGRGPVTDATIKTEPTEIFVKPSDEADEKKHGRSCSSLLNCRLSLIALFIAFHVGVKLLLA